MSIDAINAALKYTAPSSTAKLVLLVLANRANADGVCWPSVSTIAEETQLKDRAIRNALAALVGAGAIEKERRKRADGTNTSDRFRLMIEIGDQQAALDAGSDDQRHIVPNPAASNAGGHADQRHLVHQQAALDAGHTTFEPSLEEPSPQDARSAAKTASLKVEKYPAEFEAAWEAYPRVLGRTSKAQALPYWRTAARASGGAARLQAAIEAAARKGQAAFGDKGFPGMHLWLKNSRYEDWLPTDPNAPAAPIREVSPQEFALRVERFKIIRQWEPTWGPIPADLVHLVRA